MSLLRKKKFVAFVFTLLGGLILYNVWFFTLGKKKPATSAPSPEASEPSSDGSGSEADASRPAKSAGTAPAAKGTGAQAAVFGRDPFLLPEEEAAGKSMETIWRERLEAARSNKSTPLHEILTQLGLLNLTAILYDEARPLAVVNHGIVRRGDSLMNGFFEVAAIRRDAVLVRHGDNEFPLVLPERKALPDRKKPKERGKAGDESGDAATEPPESAADDR